MGRIAGVLVRRPTRADQAAVAVGLLVLALMTTSVILFNGSRFPVAALMLGAVCASAFGGVVAVGLVAGAAVTATVAVAIHEGYAGTGFWSRVVVVAAAGAASCGVAAVRAVRERALAHAAIRERAHEILQRTLMPRPLSTEHVQVRSEYRPGTAELALCGDFIDVVPYPAAGAGAVAFCVGDVTGHDAVAAAVASSLRAAWRVQALSGGTPDAWLAALDRLMKFKALDERLATACVGIIDPTNRRLLVASAGHPRPILLGNTATIIEVEPGPPLGLPFDAGQEWSSDAVGLDPECAVVLYTDGLVEGRRAPGSTVRYGEDSLAAWLNDRHPAHTVENGDIDELFRDIERANGEPLRDDVTVLVLGCHTACDATVPPQREHVILPGHVILPEP